MTEPIFNGAFSTHPSAARRVVNGLSLYENCDFVADFGGFLVASGVALMRPVGFWLIAILLEKCIIEA